MKIPDKMSLISKYTPIGMHGGQFLSQHESEASALANNPSQDCCNMPTPDDTVWHWQLTRKPLEGKLPVGRLRAAKYLQTVECELTRGRKDDVDSLL